MQFKMEIENAFIMYHNLVIKIRTSFTKLRSQGRSV